MPAFDNFLHACKISSQNNIRESRSKKIKSMIQKGCFWSDDFFCHDFHECHFMMTLCKHWKHLSNVPTQKIRNYLYIIGFYRSLELIWAWARRAVSPSGTILLPSDTAIFSELGGFGARVVTLDHVSWYIAACNDSIPRALVPKLLQAVALDGAVYIAPEENCNAVICASGCLSLVQRITSSVCHRPPIVSWQEGCLRWKNQELGKLAKAHAHGPKWPRWGRKSIFLAYVWSSVANKVRGRFDGRIHGRVWRLRRCSRSRMEGLVMMVTIRAKRGEIKVFQPTWRGGTPGARSSEVWPLEPSKTW